MLFSRDLLAAEGDLTAVTVEEYKQLMSICEDLVDKLAPAANLLSKVADPFPKTLQREHISFISQRHPDIFAKRFFFKNVVKCAIASHYYRTEFRTSRRIIDLGTGPGTFLFAFANTLKNHEFVGIDSSSIALKFASRMFSTMRVQPPLLIESILPNGIVGGGKFFTASYLLEELSPEDRSAFCLLLARRLDAQFLVVDYPKIAQDFADLLGGIRKCIAREFHVELPAALSEKVGDDYISFGSVHAAAAASTFGAIPRQLEKS